MTKIVKMETTVSKLHKTIKSEKIKAVVVDLITYLFIALFAYTTYSKFTTIDEFTTILKRSPLIGNYNIIVAWAVLIVESLTAILLIIPKTKKLGLVIALIVMIGFTAFLTYGILSGSKLPCHCGGVISTLSWQEHIWFNIGFIVLALIGLKLYKRE